MINLVKIEPYSGCNDDFCSQKNILDLSPIQDDVIHSLLLQDRQNYINDYVNGDLELLELPSEFYKHVALDVVSETLFHHPYPYITEKTIRCIINKRMFVLVAAPGTLEYLKSLGIQTFDDIIDESYDNEQDPTLRLLQIAQVVKKFCAIPIEDIKDYYRKNVNKFEHNANVFYNIQKNELERLKKEVIK